LRNCLCPALVMSGSSKGDERSLSKELQDVRRELTDVHERLGETIRWLGHLEHYLNYNGLMCQKGSGWHLGKGKGQPEGKNGKGQPEGKAGKEGKCQPHRKGKGQPEGKEGKGQPEGKKGEEGKGQPHHKGKGQPDGLDEDSSDSYASSTAVRAAGARAAASGLGKGGRF
jgi:hypothetical protein